MSALVKRAGRGAVLLAAGLLISSGYPRAVGAQTTGVENAQRVIQGKVIGADSAPLSGAIVYLKNDGSGEIRTYISTAGGSYRFGQLSTTADYRIWAEAGGKKSKDRVISSFDTKKQLDVDLKVDQSK